MIPTEIVMKRCILVSELLKCEIICTFNSMSKDNCQMDGRIDDLIIMIFKYQITNIY